MSEPIKAGDLAEVVGGLGRSKSPNLGLRVKVLSLQGEHSQHGRIWRCEGAGVKQMNDAGQYIDTGYADFASSWLRKIDPPTGYKKSQSINNEITA